MFVIAADFLDPLVPGLVAGWGVAIPLGAIGVLIVDAGMRGGFRPAAAAAAGVATADFLYAAVAAAAGAAVAAVLAPHAADACSCSPQAVLVGVAAFGFLSLRRRQDAAAAARRAAASILRFVALTSVNPATVAYFAALIAGLPAVASAPAGAKVVFVVAAGVGVAELAARARRARARRSTTGCRPPRGSGPRWPGNALVLALALRMALDNA